ncbi:MAG: phosphatase PAP2 family protein [Chloroflexota bacterium]|nr:phosphatase PAP2 family protein [Chloroflexota bacterium]
MNPRGDSASGRGRGRASRLAAATMLIVVGVVLGLFAHGDRLLWGDARMLEWMQSLDFAGLREFVAVINAVGGTIGGVIIAVGLIGVGFAAGRRDYAALVAIILGLRLIGEVLKPTFRSPRPDAAYIRFPDEHAWTTFGYPSGHAFTHACIAGALLILVLTIDLHPVWRWLITLLAISLPLLGGFARVWIGAHWPFDTLGGLLFGGAVVLTALAIRPMRPCTVDA